MIDLVESEKGNRGEGSVESVTAAETMVLGFLWERLKVGLWGTERRRGGLQWWLIGRNLGFMRIEERRERMLLVVEKRAIVVVWSWRMLFFLLFLFFFFFEVGTTSRFVFYDGYKAKVNKFFKKLKRGI